MEYETIKHWLHLCNTPQMGPIKIHKLIKHFSSPEKIIALSVCQLKSIGLSPKQIHWIKQDPGAWLKPIFDWLHQNQRHHILTIQHPDYPQLLKNIADAPPLLYVSGNLKCLNKKQIAIIGSRNPTDGGKRYARAFAQALGEIGLTITSGLALGVDGQAHLGALDKNLPTIGVLGSGLMRLYPKKHMALAENMLNHGGALISELAPNTSPQRHHFPRRNRIISGMSLGTLVIEAGRRSGSLITAHAAMEAGREVMALPGNLDNPLSQGGHYLIQQGAHLVTNVTDIAQILQLDPKAPPDDLNNHPLKTPLLDKDCEKVLNCIGYNRMSIDSISDFLSLNITKTIECLEKLKAHGYIKSSDALYYRE